MPRQRAAICRPRTQPRLPSPDVSSCHVRMSADSAIRTLCAVPQTPPASGDRGYREFVVLGRVFWGTLAASFCRLSRRA